MTLEEILEELRNLHGQAKTLSETIARNLPKGVPLAELTQVGVDGEQYGYIYNDASCLEYFLRGLIKRATPPERDIAGENIIDFGTEAKKHRNKSKTGRKKPL